MGTQNPIVDRLHYVAASLMNGLAVGVFGIIASGVPLEWEIQR